MEFNDAGGDGAGAATLSRRYLHGPAVDQVLASEDFSAGTVNWALADEQGTIRDVARYSGATTTIVTHRKFDAFGNLTSETNPGGGSAVPFLFSFTGREWDADAEMYHYRARWYDARVGRFASEDPIGFSGGDTNLNRYVGNSPVNGRDASGLEEEEREWATGPGVDEILEIFYLLYGDDGQRFLNYFIAAGGRISVEGGWIGYAPWSDYDVQILEGHPLIQIGDNVDSITAARDLMDLLRQASANPQVEEQITLAFINKHEDEDLKALQEANRQAYQAAAGYAAALSELYIQGITCNCIGADIAFLLDDIDKGNLVGIATGLVPLTGIPAIRYGGGKILINASQETVDELVSALRKLKTHEADIVADALRAAPRRVLGNLDEGGRVFRGGLDKTMKEFVEANPSVKGWSWGPETFFDEKAGKIIFRDGDLVRSVNLADELQHAADFAGGLKGSDIVKALKERGFDLTTRRGLAEANQWWHRRVFTRALQNIEKGTPGFANLKKYIGDIYDAYKRAGGQLELDDLLKRNFEGPF